MRGPLLLLMDNFVNDWDLQAVVRSCSFAHPEPAGPAVVVAGARGAAAPEEAAPAQAPPRGEAALERAAPAACAPVPAAATRGPAPTRASTPAAVPSASREASRLYELEYLDLDHKPTPFLLSPPSSRAMAGDDGREVMISFPAAAAASTSGVQPRAAPLGRKAGARTPRPKRSKKSQLKKVVREMPVADGGVSSSDPWAWRKYGQKPIKGSPYPRGYYKCSSMKGCMARKLVERSPAKPGVLIVTYMAEHCHPVPTQLNALAGTTRHKSSSSAAAAEDHRPAASSPRSHEQDPAGRVANNGNGADDAAARREADGNETSSNAAMTVVECGAEEEAAAAAAEDDEFWAAGMELDELLAPVDDDFDFDHVVEEDAVLGRRLSL
ncbi:hypothetical protein ACP70R_037150 [Stipagrostis hirtigluma subsp. patula]